MNLYCVISYKENLYLLMYVIVYNMIYKISVLQHHTLSIQRKSMGVLRNSNLLVSNLVLDP